MISLQFIYNEVTSQCKIIYTCDEESEGFVLNMSCPKENLLEMFDSQVAIHLQETQNIKFHWEVHGDHNSVMKCDYATRTLKQVRNVVSSVAGNTMIKVTMCNRLTRDCLNLFTSK